MATDDNAAGRKLGRGDGGEEFLVVPLTRSDTAEDDIIMKKSAQNKPIPRQLTAAWAACALMPFILMQNVYALDIKTHASNAANAVHNWYVNNVSEKEIEAYTAQEHNRSFEHCRDLSALGSVTLYERLTLRGGFSYGEFGETGEVKTFGSARIGSDPAHPWGRLGALAHIIHNETIDYDIETLTLLALLTLDSRKLKLGFTFGGNLMFSSYFDEPYFFEPGLSYSLYYDFVRNDKWGLRGTFANYSDFVPKLTGGWASFWLSSDIRISKKWTIINEVQFYNCGEDIFSMTFYGVAWRGGARYSW